MSDRTLPSALYEAQSYDYAEARALMDALDLVEPVAITLTRRGHRTVDQARTFLEASVRHPAAAFSGIEDAAQRIRAAIEDQRRITVHGDYDVDGMAATAILVGALRRAGAECDWLIPDRALDGYGLSAATVTRLAERGTGLLITADCGVASPEEIELAGRAGIEAIVTDHHQPGESLPDCPIVHPAVSGYPFDGLCGAAVAHKLVSVLEGEESSRDLDLVALATVADMVPLVDENRTLVRLGLAELRRARRPGVRALVAAAGVEPEHLDEGDIAFRLAPRLNAAGRLYRADAGVELLITGDRGRAGEIAAELDSANHERREVEREVHRQAEESLRGLPESARAAAGVVVGGEGWHPGVVGIVASRMVERHGKPAIVLSVDDGGVAKGSGRGVAGLDLLAALQRCEQHLERFGGHRAAAGLELPAERIDQFREAFAEAVAEQLPEGAADRSDRIDAVVGAEGLDMRAAEQLSRLGPFGQGNPEPKLLVPWARVGEIRPMGEQGRHARFSLSSGGASAGGVAFNANSKLNAASSAPHDLTVRLELNHWNGAVEPRAVLDGAEAGGAEAGASCRCGEGTDGAWWEAFEAEIGRTPGELPSPVPPPASVPGVDAEQGVAPGRDGARTRISHPDRSAVALVGELLSSGARVIVVSADARRRAELAAAAASPERFGGGYAIVCARCPQGSLAALTDGDQPPQLLLTDWRALASAPGAASGYGHLVCVDPPPLESLQQLVIEATGAGFAHEAWSGAGELPILCWAEEWQPRSALAEIYRAAVAAPIGGEALSTALLGSGALRRAPHVAARCVRVLGELGIAELDGKGADRVLRVLSSERTELERSGAWGAYTARFEEGRELLESRTAN